MKIEGKDVKIYIGEITEEEEAKGPFPKPNVTDLRQWDMKLLARYKPVYNTQIKTCQYCAFGPCDLNAGRRGACGIDLKTHTAREVLFTSVTGASAHGAHGRHMFDYLLKKGEGDKDLDVAENTEIITPLITLITGLSPKKIRDLEEPLRYVEKQLSALMASLHFGQESSALDFESKTLHAGMIDLLGMEIADVLQIAAYGFPKGAADTPLIETGFGSIDQNKPVILCIGHNVSSGVEIVDYANENGIDIEIAGICCTAHDLARYDKSAKVVGSLSYQIPFVRSGIADVLVLDEQCVRHENLRSAESLGMPVITTCDKIVGGFDDLSDKNPDDVAKSLASGKIKGAYLPDMERAGEVAVKTAILVHKKDKKIKSRMNEIDKCTSCGLCTKACPVGLDVMGIINTLMCNTEIANLSSDKVVEEPETAREIILKLLKTDACSPTELAEELKVSRQYIYKILDSLDKVHKIKSGKDVFYSLSKKKLHDLTTKCLRPDKNLMSDRELLESLEKCIFCGRCESWCPVKIHHISIYSEILRDKLMNEKGKLRAGRGQIQDTEIREVGRPIVFGDIPGVIAPVGCPAYPDGPDSIREITETFLQRNYIVITSGCVAITLSRTDLFEKYSGAFEKGGLINTGSCVSNAHIAGATIKIASIFARRNLNSNFEEIADYILNRVGAVGIVWGTCSQKAFSIASGCNRLGIPVIVGPLGKNYRRDLRSDDKTDWSVYDTRGDGKYDTGPVPEHLFYTAQTKEEVIVLAAKLCMRASDGVKGRQMKIAHYVSLHEKYYGGIPSDINRFVRNEKDIPFTIKEKIMKTLKKQKWKPVEKIPDPTLLERLSGGGK